MLYFDILEPIRVLPDSDKGRLLVAMLEYGQSGVVPELDGALSIVWSFVRPMIDKDGERYDEMKLQREYAVFCKKRKRIWMPKILFEDWVCMTADEKERAIDPVKSRMSADNETQRADNEPLSPDNETQRAVISRKPTTTTSTPNNVQSHNTISSNNVQQQSSVSNNNLHLHDDAGNDGDGGDDTDKIVKVLKGKLGKGVVFLSDAQISDLLEKMDIETFDHYVDKLSSFIIKNDAKVKNHYETILRWWQEDGAVGGQNRKATAPKGASGKLGAAELNNIQRLIGGNKREG